MSTAVSTTKKRAGRGKKGERQKSKPIRLSEDVTNFIKKHERLQGRSKKEPFDSILRRLFGLPTRTGEDQKKQVFWKPKDGDKVFEQKADAAGEAVLIAHRRGKKKTGRVIKLLEWG